MLLLIGGSTTSVGVADGESKLERISPRPVVLVEEVSGCVVGVGVGVTPVPSVEVGVGVERMSDRIELIGSRMPVGLGEGDDEVEGSEAGSLLVVVRVGVGVELGASTLELVVEEVTGSGAADELEVGVGVLSSVLEVELELDEGVGRISLMIGGRILLNKGTRLLVAEVVLDSGAVAEEPGPEKVTPSSDEEVVALVEDAVEDGVEDGVGVSSGVERLPPGPGITIPPVELVVAEAVGSSTLGVGVGVMMTTGGKPVCPKVESTVG